MTTTCDLKPISDLDGKIVYRCAECGKPLTASERDPARIFRNCSKAGPPRERKLLSDGECTSLFGKTDPTLLGERIKALTDAIGLPECGGCKKRREWINKAHAWVLSFTAPESGS